MKVRRLLVLSYMAIGLLVTTITIIGNARVSVCGTGKRRFYAFVGKN